MNVFLGLYVKYATETEEGHAFLVCPVGSTLGVTVTRREKVFDPLSGDVNTVWSCPCTEPDAPRCDHITRALLYYSNMIEDANRMKMKVKAMAQEKIKTRLAVEALTKDGSQPTSLLDTKRKIKLED